MLNDRRYLAGRWDSSLEWLRAKWPHAARCGLRCWAHLDNPGAMLAAPADGLRKLIAGQLELALFTNQAAAEKWLRAGLAEH